MEKTKMLKKINGLEKELKELKVEVLKTKTNKKNASLMGIFKGAKITDKDIEKAKKSLFKGAYL